MKEMFRAYFRPTEAEIRELWDNCLFSFDASVLLNVYGYSKETRDELVNVVEKNAERMRLPYQFGLEYARNRSGVIMKQVSNYQKIEKELDRINQEHIVAKRDHPHLSEKSLKAYRSIRRELAESRSAIEKLISLDPYAQRILEAFKGRVGKAPSAEVLAKLHAEAKDRYDKKIPPGYVDRKDKDEPECYGDYIAWRQLMDIAQSENKGVVLVIDDVKGDWWQIERERTIGPLPELLEEFARVTAQRIYFYTSESFLLARRRFANAVIHDRIIEEVRLRLASQRQAASEAKAAIQQPTIQLSEKASPPASGVEASEIKSTVDLAGAPDAEKLQSKVE